MRLLGRALPLLGLLAFGGCKEATDFGAPCRIMVPKGDGTLEVVKSNDPRIDPRFDFLSSGNSDCENLLCLREAGVDYGESDADGNAHGICSTPCIDVTDCGEPEKALDCQKLGFDQEYLDKLKQADPKTFADYFGESASATYCIDPNAKKLSSK